MTTAVAPDLQAHLAHSRACLGQHATDEEIAVALAEMVAHRDYPCLGARSVFRRDTAQIAVLPSMGTADLDTLGERLRTFTAEHGDSEDLVSFIAVFREPVPRCEREFENSLWNMLQELHDHDEKPWADDVSCDPSDPRFAFSLGGTPFFIVGLHPAASRAARRAPLPTVVFNLHRQFERLRADGTFDRMRTAIRRRDERLQGSVNPMVDDYGSASAARQYSGRAVEVDWRAPFTPHRSHR